MLKRNFLLITMSGCLANLSNAEVAKVNLHSDIVGTQNAIPKTLKLKESYPTPEEIDKMMRIHFPKEWSQKQLVKNNSPAETNIPLKTPNKTQTKATEIEAKPKETIRVRQVAVGKTIQQKLSEHRASDIQKIGVDTKYRYNPKLYTMLPDEVKNIGLIGRVNATSVGSLRIYRDVSSKAFADAYFQQHQFHSELFSAYLARKITLNGGVLGENITLLKAFNDELEYKFSKTQILSVRSAKEAEDKYLYILLRLTPSDRVQFWKYINTLRTGDTVNVPQGITIADVLTADI